MIDSFFPYGTFPLDKMFQERYNTDYSHASHYPLADTLPFHHPLLKRLEGTYSLPDRPAPWWPACVAEVDPVLREVLSTVSAREFREGCIEALRWKQFRQSLSEEQRRMVPQSPKLAPMLEQTDWLYAFQQRGASDTPAQLNLVISTS
ncbi:MAG TPA: hypothetical protein VFV38_44645, partial [Ktedonobacteraceae bacterium]|nr:hypothetical protein [Ktedonobacteraceae bacterium]